MALVCGRERESRWHGGRDGARVYIKAAALRARRPGGFEVGEVGEASPF